MVSVMGKPRAAATNASAIPVFPLVGSTSSLPATRTPRFSASHTIEAPMRHFTEYAGFRPSILAQTVARELPTTWFNFTSGVLPILRELSSNLIEVTNVQDFRSYLPIVDRQSGDPNRVHKSHTPTPPATPPACPRTSRQSGRSFYFTAGGGTKNRPRA